MTTNDQAAIAAVSAKSGWVKPEIVSFTPAATAQGLSKTVTNDAGINNLS